MKKNAIVGQSGGPTVAINASLAGVYESCKNRGAEIVYGMRYGIAGLLEKNVVDMSQVLENDSDVELLKRTPASFLGSCRYKLPDAEEEPEIYEKVFAILEELEIQWFFYIGGNDSMDTICKLSAYGRKINSEIRFVGVPKTIDNDLMATDHTPGYGSAAKFIGTMMKEIIRDSDVYGIQNITVVEIMGRNAGWLTAATALAKGDDCEGVDMICLPEVPFSMDDFVAMVEKKLQEKPSVVIAVSEGIKLEDGTYVCELTGGDRKVDAFQHKMLTGTAQYLATMLGETLGVKTRAIEFSTLQRCASHLSSATDIRESYQVGGAAVKAAFEGETGVMAALKRISDNPYLCTTDLYPINDIANKEKTIPTMWIDEENCQMKEDFLTYLRPLVEGETSQMSVHGLPQHIVIF